VVVVMKSLVRWQYWHTQRRSPPHQTKEIACEWAWHHGLQSDFRLAMLQVDHPLLYKTQRERCPHYREQPGKSFALPVQC